jgi:hypothetical protein
MRRFGTIAAVVALGLTLRVFAADEPRWSDEQREHWSFRPPSRPEIPKTTHASWERNPIDAFIAEGLELFAIDPAPEADRETLIRRVHFDLTGLPPTPAEIDAFLADPRPDAYERLVDSLLDSPEYGERWARHWLDLARYAESDGFKSDKDRPNAWRYRDWAVDALNRDMPYDQFVRLQLAGDELAPGDPEAFLATAFNRNWPFEDNNMVPGLNHQLMLDDMTDTTASVFLGLTIGCARCHDHKFDPISQKDYYRFQALFAATEPDDARPLAEPFDIAVNEFVETEHQARLAAVKREKDAIEYPFLVALLKDRMSKLPADVRKAFDTEPAKRDEAQNALLAKHAKEINVEAKVMRSAMPDATRQLWESVDRTMQTVVKAAPAPLPVGSGMADTGPDAPPIHLLFKGNFGMAREVVGPGFPSVLVEDRDAWNGSEHAPPYSTGRRAALAEWMTRPEHPLTARVMINRIWQGHFGRGIVATASDFGTQGAAPTHPELLDWLATEFIARGWSMKAMHRLMTTSATYRQSSIPSAKALKEDPDNLLLGRMIRRRLEGEAVRDALLAVSGSLDRRIGGPSVFPDLPPGVNTRGGWDRSKDEHDRNRRSVYIFVRRNLKYPLFDAFDAPDSNITCPERNVSVNAPQALMLLNSDLVLDESRALADRLLHEVSQPDDPASLATAAYRLALGRSPHADELSRSVSFLTADSPTVSRDALIDFCHAVVNLNEFVFVD